MKKILIVDDDKTLRLVLEKFLSQKGYQVTTVEAVIDAIRILEEIQFDVVISDINLPQINGFEFLLWMKKNRINSQIIIITSQGSAQGRKVYSQYGLLNYLDKPIKLDEISKVIESSDKETFQGKVNSIGIFDFVQMLIIAQRTLSLSIKSMVSGIEGQIFFNKGEVIHAEYGDFFGIPAFYKLLSIQRGIFWENEWKDQAVQTIEAPSSYLLMEAGRILDEEWQKNNQLAWDEAQNQPDLLAEQIKVLLVDSDLTNSNSIKSFLTAKGYYVVCTDSAGSAAPILKQSKFDLLISEINMPEVNGIEFMFWVKKEQIPIKVILITAHGNDDIQSQALASGAVKYLEKPITPLKLLPAIDEVLTSGITGNINEISLWDFVQMVLMSGKSQKILVKEPVSKIEGHIYIQKGKVLHAEFDDKKGKDAFFFMMGFPRGEFSEAEWTEPSELSVNLAATQLLIKTAQFIDEVKNRPSDWNIDSRIIQGVEQKIKALNSGEIEVKTQTPVLPSPPLPTGPRVPLPNEITANANAKTSTTVTNPNLSFSRSLIMAPKIPFALNQLSPKNPGGSSRKIIPLECLMYLQMELSTSGNRKVQEPNLPLPIFQLMKRVTAKITLDKLYQESYSHLSLENFLLRLSPLTDYSFTKLEPPPDKNINWDIRIGEILAYMKTISMEQMEQVSEIQTQNPQCQKIGEILVEKGIVNSQQCQDALRCQKLLRNIIG